LVSVVIPVFNGEDYLGDALASVAGQTFENLEIIVVDDGSTDRTAQVVSRFDHPALRYFRQDRAGAASARNRGVGLAGGSLVAFLDADDLWFPRKLEMQLDALEAGRGDIIFTRIEEFLSADVANSEAVKVRLKQGQLNGVSASTGLIGREEFHKVGPFDPTLRIAEFIDWFSRAEEAGLKAHIVPEVLARRRVHRNNQTRLNPGGRREYSQVMKRTLDRRRARKDGG
jgi:glycosyltransferase involved in cell wall biosynthesis